MIICEIHGGILPLNYIPYLVVTLIIVLAVVFCEWQQFLSAGVPTQQQQKNEFREVKFQGKVWFMLKYKHIFRTTGTGSKKMPLKSEAL